MNKRAPSESRLPSSPSRLLVYTESYCYLSRFSGDFLWTAFSGPPPTKWSNLAREASILESTGTRGAHARGHQIPRLVEQRAAAACMRLARIFCVSSGGEGNSTQGLYMTSGASCDEISMYFASVQMLVWRDHARLTLGTRVVSGVSNRQCLASGRRPQLSSAVAGAGKRREPGAQAHMAAHAPQRSANRLTGAL